MKEVRRNNDAGKAAKAWHLLLLIIVLRLLLSVSGIAHPVRWPDEDRVIAIAAHFGGGDLNPHWFLYPSLYLYFVFGLMGLFFVAGYGVGVFESIHDYSYYYFTNVHVFQSMARSATVVLGLAQLYLVYRLSVKTGRKSSAIAGTFLLAVSALHFKMSMTAKPDTMMLFFIIMAILSSLNIGRLGRLRDYLTAGVFCGLSVGSKYPAAPIVLTVFTAHIYACRDKGLSWRSYLFGRDLILAALASIASFIVTSPYLLIDWRTALKDIMFQADLYSNPFTLWDGPAAWYHLTVSVRQGAGTGIEILGLAGVITALKRHKREDVIVLSFPVFYFIFMGAAHTALTRYSLPVIPFLCIYGAGLLFEIYESLRQRLSESKFYVPVLKTSLIVILASISCVPIYRDIKFSILLSKDDTRIIAADWMQKNLEPDSSVFQVYCSLELPQSREQLEREIGYRDSRNESSTRAHTLLADPDYPETTAFFIYNYSPYSFLDELDETNPFILTRFPEGDMWDKIDYMAVCEEERIKFFTSNLPMDEILSRGELIAKFRPFPEGYKPESIFDTMDDLYFPVANAKGLTNPGSTIYIYKVKK